MEDNPITLGNTGIDDDRVPASPPGSPAAETLTGMITHGVGRRSGPTAWAFDVNDPPLNHEQHAMVVELSLESMAKVTCENRLPWVDFAWRWPHYPVTCAVSQRKPDGATCRAPEKQAHRRDNSRNDLDRRRAYGNRASRRGAIISSCAPPASGLVREHASPQVWFDEGEANKRLTLLEADTSGDLAYCLLM